MEDYLQYMKTLRSQMNEVEDQAAKISAEEQMQLTTIQNMEKDLDFMKNETRRLKEEIDNLMKANGLICSKILEKQKKITSLESDSNTLSQTTDLMRNERATLSAKFAEKRTYYAKVVEDITTKLNEQQAWISTNILCSSFGEKSLDIELEGKIGNNAGEIEGSLGNATKSLMMKLDRAKADFDASRSLKSNLVLKTSKMKQSLELMKGKINNFKPVLKEMDGKLLEEELQALLSDKAGETEYLQSMQLHISKLKEISHTIKCSCGEEFKVELCPCA